MIVFGYAIDSKYEASGEFRVKVRIPAVHGPMDQLEYRGKRVTNYTPDSDLPFYASLILPHLPSRGEVVAVATTGDAPSTWLVLGYTGAQYSPQSSTTGR